MRETISIKDFTPYQVPFSELKNMGINYSYEDAYAGKVFVFEEELKIKNLFLDNLADGGGSFFVFRKDVYVENALTQKEMDYGPVVLFQGNVEAKNIWTGGGDVIFEKDVVVGQTFIGVYNHGTTIVQGEVSAEIVISDDHSFDAQKIIKGCTLGEIKKNEYSAEDLLHGKYYDKWNDCLRTSAILKAILKGESILSNKPILSPLEKRIAKMKNSKTKNLDLSFMNNLVEIPEEVWALEEITSLDISGNYVTEISEKIASLKQLKAINLSNCEFTSFPEALLLLPNLETINLSENSISNLPENLTVLQSIKKLNFSNCSFPEIPDVLYSLPLLSDLDISSQKVESKLLIEKVFPKLKKLNLAGNFQPEIKAVQAALSELDMAKCGLTELPDCVVNMKGLTFLNIMNNKFLSIPSNLQQLTNLKDFAFDLYSLCKDGCKLLNMLPKLKAIRIEVEDVPSSQIELILQIQNWTKLYTDEPIEDMFIVKKILERSSLQMIDVNGYKVDIESERKMLKISI